MGLFGPSGDEAAELTSGSRGEEAAELNEYTVCPHDGVLYIRSMGASTMGFWAPKPLVCGSPSFSASFPSFPSFPWGSSSLSQFISSESGSSSGLGSSSATSVGEPGGGGQVYPTTPGAAPAAWVDSTSCFGRTSWIAYTF